MSARSGLSHVFRPAATLIAAALCLEYPAVLAAEAQQEHAGHLTKSPAEASFELPPPTAAERAAAFPDVTGHQAHDDAVNYYLLFDQLEWQDAAGGSVLNWDATAWVGRDVDRLWLRAEGEREDDQTASSGIEALWGHAFSRWWEFVAGIRQDFQPGPSQTWAAVGVQGIAPYKFATEATAYVGESGQTALRLKTEYELLLTNRLVLQPLVEIQAFGKDDPERAVGSGLSTTEVGLRLRYEIRREIAPYLGVTWNRRWGDTADLAGADVEETRWLAGIRIWF